MFLLTRKGIFRPQLVLNWPDWGVVFKGLLFFTHESWKEVLILLRVDSQVKIPRTVTSWQLKTVARYKVAGTTTWNRIRKTRWGQDRNKIRSFNTRKRPGVGIKTKSPGGPSTALTALFVKVTPLNAPPKTSFEKRIKKWQLLQDQTQ